MPKVDETTREGRKERVFLHLRRNALGLTEAELAEELGFEGIFNGDQRPTSDRS